MLKKLFILTTLLFYFLNLNAQEEYSFKLAIEAGGLPLSNGSENLGLFLNVEPKIKILENTFMGLRIGVIINSQSFENNDISQFFIDETSDNGGISLVPTIDYYLNKNTFRPFLGIGVGPYLLTKYVDAFVLSSQSWFEVNVDTQLGFLLRGGVESDKLRLGVEYNFISKADIKIPNGQVVGTVNNSYLGLSIGFKIGGWKK